MANIRRALGRLIFASSANIQSLVQHLIGGPRLEAVAWADGHLFDCFTSERYYWFGDSYENDEQLELKDCLTPDSVLYDVGAHAGFWEVLLASRCRHIYAFEPSPSNFTRLARNIAQNQIGNVTLVPALASDQTGKLRFVENGSMSHVSNSGIEVTAITLDDYAFEHACFPTVVKIDVEGMAGAVLGGMRRVLSQTRPILFIELHDKNEVTACHHVVSEFGYKSMILGKAAKFPYRARLTAVGEKC